MQPTLSLDQSQALSKSCLDFLNRHNLAASPHNYAVVFEMILGKKPEIKQQVAKLIEAKNLDSFTLNEIYHEYIENGYSKDESKGYLDSLEALVADIESSCYDSACSIDTFQQALKTQHQALHQRAKKPEQVIAALTRATRQIQQDQEQTHQRLHDTEQELKQLRASIERLEREAFTDPLSQLLNRKGFETALANRPVIGCENCVLMLDIDRFKNLNDQFGHLYGDNVIRQVSREIAQNIRGVDLGVRWGGEEFLVVLRETDRKGGLYVAEKIRKSIQKLRWKNSRTGEELPPVTISIGFTQMRSAEDLQKDQSAILDRADEALYKAKNGGRNQVCS